MDKTVLVLTNIEDGIHSDSVIAKLRERDIPVFRLNTDSISGGDCVVNFLADDKVVFEFLDRLSGSSVSSTEIGSVWYRRPNILKVKVNDSAQRKQAEADLKSFLDGLWLTLPHVFWMSGLPQLERSRRKILQLSLAKELGFLVPKTLVTNDPIKVRQFFRACGNRVIFKCLSEGWLDCEDGGLMIPTTLLTESHLERIDLVRSVPALFQEFIPKSCDVRVTVVGRKLFVAKIDSQHDPTTMVDWRHPEKIGSIGYSEIRLPTEIADKCLRLVNELGLVFGAIDFAVDKSGKYYFLEINPNGQWYWLEYFAGLLISDAITDMLVLERR